MGKYVKGINGPITGKVGVVSGSSWNGITYFKGPYKKRTLHISEKEQNNRLKFKMAQDWLGPTLEFVRQGFKNFSPTNKGFSAAKSLIYHAFEGEGADLWINPARVLVSYGNLPLSENISVIRIDDNHLKFTWDKDPVTGGKAEDQIMVLVYDIQNGMAAAFITGQFRETGEYIVKVPKIRNYHIYVAFTAADRQRQSNSLYLGEISM